jgi:hypothetical protein
MKIDRNGWEYYDKLPDGFSLAKLDDFHVKGKKNIGMIYLIQRGGDPNHFEIHYVSETLTALTLKIFIDTDQVFVKHAES